MKKIFNLGLLLVISLASFQANANLILNGSFEDVGMQTAPEASPGGYGVYATIPGWIGFDSIEIHPSGFLGNASQDEGYHAELSAHPAQMDPFRLEQNFATVVGQLYEVSFYAQKRQADDGVFTVKVGDLDEMISTHMVDMWSLHTFLFTASALSSTLSFATATATATLDGSDTVGHFLDNVSVSAVPLPGAILLLAGGLLGLGAFRKREVASAA